MSGFLGRIFGEKGGSGQHLVMDNLAGFLNSFHTSGIETPEQFAEAIGSEVKAGSILFCLEKSKFPGQKTAAAFSVQSICLAVNEQDQRALAVCCTNNQFELRFLEVYLLEQARKALLDSSDFYFMLLMPIRPLRAEQIDNLARLGSAYAAGGARKEMLKSKPGAPGEPLREVLIALRAVPKEISEPNNLIDLTEICQSLFNFNSPENPGRLFEPYSLN